jgi:hypothetical protein
MSLTRLRHSVSRGGSFFYSGLSLGVFCGNLYTELFVPERAKWRINGEFVFLVIFLFVYIPVVDDVAGSHFDVEFKYGISSAKFPLHCAASRSYD